MAPAPAGARRDDQRGGDRGDALAAAGQPEAVGGRRGDRHRGAGGGGQRRLRLGAARTDLGRLPITCTATLPISKPAVAHPAGRLGQQASPRWRRPTPARRCRSCCPGRRARRRRTARRSTACAATSPSEWPASPCGSSGKCRPASVHGHAVGEARARRCRCRCAGPRRHADGDPQWPMTVTRETGDGHGVTAAAGTCANSGRIRDLRERRHARAAGSRSPAAVTGLGRRRGEPGR